LDIGNGRRIFGREYEKYAIYIYKFSAGHPSACGAGLSLTGVVQGSRLSSTQRPCQRGGCGDIKENADTKDGTTIL
jgi:hypothetical protein